MQGSLLLGYENVQRARAWVQMPKKVLLNRALSQLVEHQKATLALMNEVKLLAEAYNIERKQDIGMVVSEACIAIKEKGAEDLADALEEAFKAWREQQSRCATSSSASNV
jgi:hypothetical protein